MAKEIIHGHERPNTIIRYNGNEKGREGNVDSPFDMLAPKWSGYGLREFDERKCGVRSELTSPR
jgi:hypothetical protein